MSHIEVEVRSFITREQYDTLIQFFRQESRAFSVDDQVTHYFNAPVDVRIQKNSFGSKMWLKKGKMHDEHREEVEVRFDREDFDNLEKMFLLMGYGVKVKWFRKRHTFFWKGFEVSVDDNKGYGHILEIEKKSTSKGKMKALKEVKGAFKKLGIAVTPKKTFDEKYQYYLKHWEKLTR
ncbi:CYTH domain-containing protein [Nanoarchaeota archaeon]